MNDRWKEMIGTALDESSRLKRELRSLADGIADMARMIVDCIRSGNKVMFCGNGGSAADSQHLACELVEKFSRKRRAFPAVALTTDTSILTAVPNDEGFDLLFARQIEGLGRRGDLLVAMSTSGRSPNILRALRQAREIGVRTVGLTGAAGSGMAEHCDLLLVVPSTVVARIQECHITIGHIVVDIVEAELS